MRRYTVRWTETVARWAEVDAEDEKEAVNKAKLGDVVEGSQDSDVPEKPRGFKVDMLSTEANEAISRKPRAPWGGLE